MRYPADPKLLALKEGLDRCEGEQLSPFAAFSKDGIRRQSEEEGVLDYRHSFSTDADRILHSRAYTRYIDKTQVFYMIKNDHVTHRVLHVQLVSKVARTIGRFLRLNEDLIEAIALGHDIGHPPFGHDGEMLLDGLCRDHGLSSFQHNLQSVRFLEHIEKKGKGWNLTLQTLDGIMCHDGEIHNRTLTPERDKTFAEFDRQLKGKAENKKDKLVPMTMEGCVVRFADTIAYIGRDIEDAIELNIIKRSDIPAHCRAILGETNGTIVYRLVTDLITNSIDSETLAFSPEISQALKELKDFNYEFIYMNPVIKKDFDKIENCYQVLFSSYLEQIEQKNNDSSIYADFVKEMGSDCSGKTQAAAMVCDFMAGMTDDYFLSQARQFGCEVPVKS
jgi:dGTPase